MKKIFIIMAILTLFAPVGAYACLVAFDFGYGFGFGSTGYMVWESADAPLASNVSFTASAPTSYAFDSDGNKTLYAFCRDLAGNVSATGVSDTVVVTTSGVVTYFPCVIQ
jgi:hypothetical protein